ncbi:DUF1569 domain-containing protein [Croceivirga thetidis]|uniref:DUF1569 domain-containing protein n=1 Tax=Croceivirga thetidis TaxID=2721623 RepID=A0ABX1GTF8_9FLAO|nr:DUF1569 domain-containing protein [Croceivirga thetidis]NKI33249.1 DUF1569 domain-containing protein [Croceivirga thetidis]
MKSIFEQKTYEEILNRLHTINAENTPNWGKMNAGQMMRHCQFPFETALGKKQLDKPNFLMRLLMKSFKKSMYNDKEWRKNQPTPKAFQVSDQQDFDKEKQNLLGLINEFYATRDVKEREAHPAFGHFTYNQWGQMQYKHLDHHLRQFGA